jgi:uncharacterized protein
VTEHSSRRPRLVERLLDPALYPHSADRVELIETHISWVLLAGDRVYKIKKPVDLGFLDFTTLALRRRFCQDEVRLNRRLASDIYLGVVEIKGSAGAPRFEGRGRTLEVAVVMRRFPPSACSIGSCVRVERLPRGVVQDKERKLGGTRTKSFS